MNVSHDAANYGTWVPLNLIWKPATGFVLLVIIDVALWLFGPGWLAAVVAVIAACLLAGIVYLTIARRLFLADGGRLPSRIVDLVLVQVDWSGQGSALDIGCGSGALTIKLAKKYPQASVVGVDYWGGSWEYSQEMCEANARAEGVAQRTTFRKASASCLPFDDGSFDLVVSNLAFHEVKDSPDKRAVIREALRVLKPGGKFAFQDLFFVRAFYGDPFDLVEELNEQGVKDCLIVDTSRATFIPRILKLPFMLGRIGILRGTR